MLYKRKYNTCQQLITRSLKYFLPARDHFSIARRSGSITQPTLSTNRRDQNSQRKQMDHDEKLIVTLTFYLKRECGELLIPTLLAEEWVDPLIVLLDAVVSEH